MIHDFELLSFFAPVNDARQILSYFGLYTNWWDMLNCFINEKIRLRYEWVL